MPTIHPCEVLLNSFLRPYKDGPGYADCYATKVPGTVTQAAYIEAFYTSPLFKIERTLLKYLASKPASDADAKALAGDGATRFSAWRVEAQSSTELLLADFTGRTRSWLMATPAPLTKEPPSTLLYFGSAVVPLSGQGAQSMGWLFHALLGFHRLYSRLLLRAASQRLSA
ncbi:MAG: hypothetical protein WBK51_08420 [Polaromonas sp.]